MDNVVPLRRPIPDITPDLPTRSMREQALELLAQAGYRGVTWKDLTPLGCGHGTASALLSSLHKRRTVVRLQVRRDDCKVYVLPEHLGSRWTDMPRKNERTKLLDDMAEMLVWVGSKCRHSDLIDPRCRSCAIKALLDRYANL